MPDPRLDLLQPLFPCLQGCPRSRFTSVDRFQIARRIASENELPGRPEGRRTANRGTGRLSSNCREATTPDPSLQGIHVSQFVVCGPGSGGSICFPAYKHNVSQLRGRTMVASFPSPAPVTSSRRNFPLLAVHVGSCERMKQHHVPRIVHHTEPKASAVVVELIVHQSR